MFRLLDNPLLLSMLFYPRSAQPSDDSTCDGTIPVDGNTLLGYRFYPHPHSHAPIILYFHGNGEIVSDYDDYAETFHSAGASLLVVDYRGYGWSTGKPLISTLLSDAEAVLNAVPNIAGQGVTLFVMGRSLGSAPATHLAYTYPNRFKGLIIESGFAHAPSVFGRLVGLPPSLLSRIPDIFDNVHKIAQIHLPLLVIHGERDTLIPVQNGQNLYDSSPAVHKNILRIRDAGHNDLLFYGMDEYFESIRVFLEQAR